MIVDVAQIERELRALRADRDRLAPKIRRVPALENAWAHLEGIWRGLEGPLALIRRGGPDEVLESVVIDVEQEIARLEEGYRLIDAG